MPQRPLGIAILSIWAIIAGILNLTDLAGFVRISTLFELGYSAIVISWVIDIITSLVFFVTAYGLLKALHWSWFLIIILTVVGMIAQIGIIFMVLYWFSIVKGVIYIVILGIILHYLTRPHVKTYFGKK